MLYDAIFRVLQEIRAVSRCLQTIGPAAEAQCKFVPMAAPGNQITEGEWCLVDFDTCWSPQEAGATARVEKEPALAGKPGAGTTSVTIDQLAERLEHLAQYLERVLRIIHKGPAAS